MARVQMFFDLRARLEQGELWRVAELIDEAASPDREVSRKAKQRLEGVPFRIKRDYLGLFEEVDLAMQWGLIEPEVAHYMFGYYALHCANCPAFWIDVGQWNPYWDRFHKFCERMEVEREAFERGRGGTEPIDFEAPAAGTIPPGVAGDVPVSGSDEPTVLVDLPSPLRGWAGGSREVRVQGGTVGEALLDLIDRYPELREQLFYAEDDLDPDQVVLRRYVNVYFEGSDVRFGNGLETKVPDGGLIRILPAVSGG